MRRKKWDGTAEGFRKKLEERPSGCLEWPTKGGEGYGVVGWNGVLWRAHRVAWKLHHGRIPRDLLVLHKCDNPPCCNVEHLFLGTPKENMLDKCRKGRWDGGRVIQGGRDRASMALRLFPHREFLGQDIKGFASLVGISQRQIYDFRKGKVSYLWP